MRDSNELMTVGNNCKLSKHGSDSLQDDSFYMSIIGALQYVIVTHPKLSYFVHK